MTFSHGLTSTFGKQHQLVIQQLGEPAFHAFTSLSTYVGFTAGLLQQLVLLLAKCTTNVDPVNIQNPMQLSITHIFKLHQQSLWTCLNFSDIIFLCIHNSSTPCLTLQITDLNVAICSFSDESSAIKSHQTITFLTVFDQLAVENVLQPF